MSFTTCLLVGGKGSRLGTLAFASPKCLMPIHGIPFLKLLINKLFWEGCTELILVTGHLSEVIEEFVAANFAERKITIVTESTGTGKALLAATKVSHQHDDILCVNGDTLLDLQYNEVVGFHRQTNPVATIVTTALHGLPDVGAMQIDRNNRVIGFSEKAAYETPEANFQLAINCGCYCFNLKYVKDFIESDGGASLERDILPKLVQTAEALSFNYTNSAFLDFGTPDRLETLPAKFPLTDINRIFHADLI